MKLLLMKSRTTIPCIIGRSRRSRVIIFLCIACSIGLRSLRSNNQHVGVHAFTTRQLSRATKRRPTRSTSTTPRNAASNANANANQPQPIQTAEQKSRWKELIKREGPSFKLDRFTGRIEFGIATKLVTDLSKQQTTRTVTVNKASIEDWLTSGSGGGTGFVVSIWDEALLEDLGNNTYRLQTMPLQFVTLQLQPSVDVKMWTQPAGKNRAGRQLPPIFKLQSMAFDTNVRWLPPGIGVGIGGGTSTSSSLSSEAAAALGILVEVAGDLRPTTDGTGVTGTISFQTQGVLPPPLRIVPEAVLQVAAETINTTILQFAVASFEKGVIEKYKEFMKNKKTVV
mmetsp:Transcript_55385/g.60006  ORF Transcript_55385/g.60006 Transcript_55385/m.60006 type:complete len:340 (+) Transcript_55385:167-1186(+)